MTKLLLQLGSRESFLEMGANRQESTTSNNNYLTSGDWKVVNTVSHALTWTFEKGQSLTNEGWEMASSQISKIFKKETLEPKNIDLIKEKLSQQETSPPIEKKEPILEESPLPLKEPSSQKPPISFEKKERILEEPPLPLKEPSSQQPPLSFEKKASPLPESVPAFEVDTLMLILGVGGTLSLAKGLHDIFRKNNKHRDRGYYFTLIGIACVGYTVFRGFSLYSKP